MVSNGSYDKGPLDKGYFRDGLRGRLRQAAAAHPLQAGRGFGQPARAAAEKSGGIAGRGVEQKGGGHRERPAPQDRRARGDHLAVDQQIRKILLDMIKDAEKQAGAVPAPEPAPRFTAADEQVVEQLIERLRHQILSEMATSATNPEQT